MAMKKIALIFLLFLPIIIFANLSINIDVKSPQIQNGKFSDSETVLANVGEPEISYLPLKILIPAGEEPVSIKIFQIGKSEEIKNVELDFARNFYSLSAAAVNVTEKNMKIYGTDADFPKEDFRFLGTQFLCGYQIAVLNVFPYKYNPIRKILKWSDKIVIKVETKLNSELAAQQNKNLLINEKTRKNVSRLVINPASINNYSKKYFSANRGLANPQNPHQMIIITDSAREPFFQNFVAWKIAHGVDTAIFLKENILAEPEYIGIDDQETIRNFIIDAYQSWSQTDIPLEYVILGGDDEIIPARGMWAAVDSVFAPGYEYHIVETFLPSDLYYSALDGNWNANGNEYYGEPDDEPDLLPRIQVLCYDM